LRIVSCMDGPCVAGENGLMSVWSGAVMYPACWCGAFDRWP
jgi:hypothetical protein